jgi:suppressor of ftsI
MRTGLIVAAVLTWVTTCCSVAAAHGNSAPIVPQGWGFQGERVFTAQQPPLPPPFTTGSAFREPPVVRSSNGRLRATIVARNGTIAVSGVPLDGMQTYGVGSAARGLLGPTLHVKPGDLVDLVLDNQLTQPPAISVTTPASVGPMRHDECAHDTKIAPGDPQPTNLHFHGLHVTPRNHKVGDVIYYGDNVLVCLGAGPSHIRFRIPDTHDAGTFWYHAHLHGLTDDQVFRGLAGMLIVGDSRRYLPRRFRRIKTRLMSFKDVQAINVAGRWAISTDRDPATTTRTVNGVVEPRLTIRPRETQLWRLANSSSDRWYKVALVDGGAASDPLTIVARDGNPLVAPDRVTEVLLGPGQRVDVLVRAPQSGTRTLRTLPFDQGGIQFPAADLATVDVAGAPAPPLATPPPRGKLPTFPARRGPTRTWRFNFSKKGAVINGKTFKADRIDARPRLGTTERWVLVNESTEWHPIHVHQDDFRVLRINGTHFKVRSDQDVVALPPAVDGIPGRVDLDMPFQDYSGNFVLHCHILNHEDGGMMARISVRR